MASAEVSIVCLVLALTLLWKTFSEDLNNFPPGPQRIPFAGCALLMPTKDEHKKFSQWASKFGKIVGLTIFGQKIAKIYDAGDVLTFFPTILALIICRMTFPTWNVGIMNSGNTHRSTRQMLSQTINQKSTLLYRGIITQEVKSLVKHLRYSPSDFTRHLRRSNVNIILQIFFGNQPGRVENENLVTLNNKLLDVTSLAGAPLAYLVNTFPILKYWPKFFPGGGFKADVEVGYKLVQDLFTIPIVPENANEFPFLLMHTGNKNQREIARAVSATSFSAGVETSTSTLLSFVLAMVLFPDVQRKAQLEIDTKLSGELPTLNDRYNTLPYVNAILSECYRWAPPGHLGLPHCLSQNDSIDGYVLPRGTVVLPNIWNILHDSDRHSNPMNFLPERFLGPNPEPDPREHVYGYGHRICPGRHLAEANLWLTIANMLAVFHFRMVVDDNGQPVPPVVEFTSGVMNRPRDFRCIIEPRFADETDFESDIS